MHGVFIALAARGPGFCKVNYLGSHNCTNTLALLLDTVPQTGVKQCRRGAVQVSLRSQLRWRCLDRGMTFLRVLCVLSGEIIL